MFVNDLYVQTVAYFVSDINYIYARCEAYYMLRIC